MSDAAEKILPLVATGNTVPDPRPEAEGVLSVEQSVLGKKWALLPVDGRLAQGISQSFNLPEIVGRLLVARGLKFEDVDTFLNPSIKTQLPDPALLKMELDGTHFCILTELVGLDPVKLGASRSGGSEPGIADTAGLEVFRQDGDTWLPGLERGMLAA